MNLDITPIPDTQTAYERMRAFFSRPDAVLSRTDLNTSRPSCLYRLNPHDPSSPGCAVGCLIPDTIYAEYFEGIGTVEELLEEGPCELRALFYNVELEFLRDAQDAHDTKATDAADFVRLLDEIASVYSLDPAE